jgi:pancreatic triacylglycerol lipase
LEAEDQILIFVDWSKGAKLLSYMKARENVEIAAESTSKFIEKLHNEHQVNYDSITLIGFSLGAHVVGLAGQKLENVKLPRIIGIDPAGPLFSLEEFQRRINNESAKYVECIHAGSWMNLQEHICTNDIFINGGKGQPGCFNFFRVEDSVCSHIRAVDIWTEVVKNPNKFKAVMCDDLSGALRKMCKNDETLILNDVKNSELNTEERTGIYLIETTDKAPFYIEN